MTKFSIREVVQPENDVIEVVDPELSQYDTVGDCAKHIWRMARHFLDRNGTPMPETFARYYIMRIDNEKEKYMLNDRGYAKRAHIVDAWKSFISSDNDHPRKCVISFRRDRDPAPHGLKPGDVIDLKLSGDPEPLRRTVLKAFPRYTWNEDGIRAGDLIYYSILPSDKPFEYAGRQEYHNFCDASWVTKVVSRSVEKRVNAPINIYRRRRADKGNARHEYVPFTRRGGLLMINDMESAFAYIIGGYETEILRPIDFMVMQIAYYRANAPGFIGYSWTEYDRDENPVHRYSPAFPLDVVERGFFRASVTVRRKAFLKWVRTNFNRFYTPLMKIRPESMKHDRIQNLDYMADMNYMDLRDEKDSEEGSCYDDVDPYDNGSYNEDFYDYIGGDDAGPVILDTDHREGDDELVVVEESGLDR